jgi:hypothetical protein
MENDLKDFLLNRMKMTGAYQPMVIKMLLTHGGSVSVKAIAEELARRDPESIDFYSRKLLRYPKEVLGKHGIAKVKAGEFQFQDVKFDSSEVSGLILICDEKLKQYYEKNRVEEKDSSGWGLKRVKLISAHPECTLCGARPAKNSDVELDIDHILPTSEGGSDDESNLQVLCHRCNRAKGNYLLCSSREAHERNLNKNPTCHLCSHKDSDTLEKNEYAFSAMVTTPSANMILRIVPFRHVDDPFKLNDQELLSIHRLAKSARSRLGSEPSAFGAFDLYEKAESPLGTKEIHAHFGLFKR